ncbi:MAG: DinB family protein [Phycisphaerales bacterium]
MDPCSTCRDAHAWLRWLTGRTLDACAALTPEELRREFPIGVGSVHGPLVHLAGAERVWIAVLENDDAGVVMPQASALPDVDSIRAHLAASRMRWDAYFARLTPAELARVVERHRDGKVFRQTAGDAIMQVPTHALYHNAQISFMFRSMGHALPDSSWIGWGRERLTHAS